MTDVKIRNVDEYIASFPLLVQAGLGEIRAIIQGIVPDALETISYDMPTYSLDGKSFMYFAAWKKHIALYPVTAETKETLKEELAGYKGSKDSVHFPLSKMMPVVLIEKIVSAKLEEYKRRKRV